jgi:small subunit ribosomal protein S23
MNLHVHSEGGIPLPLAYTTAATQFRTLRAEHETANRSATLQAQSHGATFFSEIDRAVLVEGRVLDGWSRAKEIQAEIAASKGQGGRPGAPAPTAAPAPSSIFTKPGETTDSEVMELGEVEFTGGVEYVTRFARRGLEDEQVEEESEDGDDVDAVAGSTK